MEVNKILSASILDLVFDDRNKEYGAYELRITYPQRIKKSLIVVFIIAAVAVTGAALANSFKPKTEGKLTVTVFSLPEIKPDEKELIPPPERKKPEPIQTRTEKLTTAIKMVKQNADLLPTQDDLKIAEVGLIKQDGPDDIGLAKTDEIDDKKGIIQTKIGGDSDEPFRKVEVEARFDGNREKFLIKNLNPTVTADNSAPVGVYRVVIQFVVDREGNVSDLKAITNHGYGLEQEAIRVIKKSDKWIPANQNGKPVKAYRLQPIIFEVTDGS
jgi:periplasmic protein TonB